ncbi:MAG: CDP-alcohol phosphatidyltransferase family protein [Gammaproteobacteria bacterium]|nr:CDP-alcohol phosphatidyltransferase family protein [Gammaproteobacteria bacterium]
MRHIPNIITTMRLLLIVPVAMLIYEQQARLALLLFFTASLSDGLDGYLARRFGWVSAFGRLMDPAADKLLLLVTAVTLTLMDQLPVMLLWLMVAKDIAVVGGLVIYTLLAGFPVIRPIWFGKFTTTIQLFMLGGIILNMAFPSAIIANTIVPALYWLVAVFTLVDGCGYVWLWTSRLVRDPRWNGTGES